MDWFDRSAAERDQTVADYMQTVAHARIPVAPICRIRRCCGSRRRS